MRYLITFEAGLSCRHSCSRRFTKEIITNDISQWYSDKEYLNWYHDADWCTILMIYKLE